MEKPAINEIRILLGSARASVANDHVWSFGHRPPGEDVAPRLLDELPTAQRYLVIVPCQRVALFRVTVPVGPRRKVREALPFLLEDRLAEPIERYEIWPLDLTTDEEGMIWLAVLERDWLAGVRTALARIRHGELRWVVAGWGWPTAPAWQLRVEGEQTILNRHGIDPITVPTSTLLETIDLALGQSSQPRAIHYDASREPTIAEQLKSFCAARNLAVQEVILPAALNADYTRCPHSLLKQTRSPLRREWESVFSFSAWPRWRPLAWCVGGWIAVELVALFLHWGLLSYEHRRLNNEATTLYREIAGPQATIVNPLLQMRRTFQDRRHIEGKQAPDDFLPLLTGVSTLLPSSVKQIAELGYEKGRLKISVPAQIGASLAHLSKTLREAGWKVQASASSNGQHWNILVSRS